MFMISFRQQILALLVVLVSAPALSQSVDQDIRRTMWSTFDAISFLLPMSLRTDGITDSDRPLIKEQLDLLISSSAALASHAREREPEFRLLAYSFDKAIARVQSSFVGKRYMDAYFSLSDMAQNCVSCHARLPDESDFLLGQKLFARMDLEMLDAEEIAQLYVATRQFDNALGKYEGIVLDPKSDPVDLDLDGIWIDYLEIGLAVVQDVERVRTTLHEFLRRQALPLYIRGQVQAWLESLDQVAGDLKGAPSLPRARELFAQATALTLVPAGRERAVHDIVASSVLRRLLEMDAQDNAQAVAESYYLLGVIALRTLRLKPAVPEMEFLLASSIRAAPESPYAARSFLLLEEFSYTNYLDFGAREIPDPDSQIQDLRDLVK